MIAVTYCLYVPTKHDLQLSWTGIQVRNVVQIIFDRMYGR